ncbi:hypothetical protein GCM10009116_21950 [Brevundimonas basaltis]|uniref:Uncharacterized protein n=1 Tax=Brevundimonas basaltis TaxID=472166 RepID=A0A7W8MGS0_9CAUL|nr:hypothetical protein [Brevundimonas basaltis]MBB5291944.1 hypothetical protein [Brevundimonas basaltis]
MLVPAFILALTVAPAQETASWGQHEWDNGTGFLSRQYFENGRGYPSGHLFENGIKAGSIRYLVSGDGRGSAHFWLNSRDPGSAFFWRNGRDPGSRHYWDNGRGCLSELGWRLGAACSSADTLILQTLCIAKAIDIPPCRPINARLDDWLSRETGDVIYPGDLSIHSYADLVVRMRGNVA